MKNEKLIIPLLIIFAFLLLAPSFAFAYCCVGENSDSGDSDFGKIIECKEISEAEVRQSSPQDKACKKYSSSSVNYYLKADAFTCCNVNECSQSKNKPCATAPSSSSNTTVQTQKSTFTPTEPKLQINIPTLQFSKIFRQGQLIDVPWLAEYISGIYKYAVGLISFVAIIMIMVGGIIWLTAGTSNRINTAKEMILGAFSGLILALGSYLVLYSINPDLVSFKQLQIKLIEREELETDIESASRDQLIINSATACNTVETCKTLCDTCKNRPSDCPTATATMADPSQIQKIPSMAGISPRNSSTKPEVITALQQVGSAAAQKGYTIQINEGYRDLQSQIKKVCDKLTVGRPEDIGKTVAWPGGSRHGIGIAVDAYLIENGKILTSGYMTQERIDRLEELMRQGGFVRYCPEWWHFELGTAGGPDRPKDLNSYCPRPYKK